MKISVCLTLLNEESSIGGLLEALLTQSKKPDEIIVVDGGSKDRTIEIVNHYQHKDSRIKLLKERCPRARGRNLGVEVANNEIIAMTDAGCIPDPDWLKRLTQPFINNEVDISAGFYKMVGKSSCQKAMSVFLGVAPSKFDVNFLPSTRSIAYRKNIIEKIGGFPENIKDTAEDTVFNFHALKIGTKYSRVKSAIVEWGMPDGLNDFFWKIFNYAKGDAKTKIWFFPGKGLASHNIKALSVLFRYLVAVILLVGAIKYNALPYFLLLFFLYLIWAFRKVFLEFRKTGIAIWGPILQISSDVAVIGGFLSGIL